MALLLSGLAAQFIFRHAALNSILFMTLAGLIVLYNERLYRVRDKAVMDALTKSEQALARREQEFRTLADSIPQLAWMADSKGWIFWYNKRWFDYTGTTLEEMQGWGWQKVHHPDHVQRVVDKFREHVVAGEPW